MGSHCFTAIGSSVVRGLMWPSAEHICDGCMPASTSVGERVLAMVLSFTLRSVPTVPVTMGDGVPAVISSTPPDCPSPSSSLPSSGQSATPSSQTLAWWEAGDSSVPLSPNRVQAGRSHDVPEEGSLFS